MLDLACGTGDLCRELARHGLTAIGARPLGRDAGTPPGRRHPWSGATAWPCRSGSGALDGIVCGFALRNFAALAPALAECARVLRPGGRTWRCWRSTPRPSRCCRLGHRIWFGKVVPFVGGLVAARSGAPRERATAAYRYLPASVAYLPPHAGTAGADLGGGLHRRRTPPPLRWARPTPDRNPLMTAGPAASTAAPGSVAALHHLVSRTRVLGPGEVDDLLDVLGPRRVRLAPGRGGVRHRRSRRPAAGASRAGAFRPRGRRRRRRAPVDHDRRAVPDRASGGPGAGPIAVGALPFDDRTLRRRWWCRPDRHAPGRRQRLDHHDHSRRGPRAENPYRYGTQPAQGPSADAGHGAVNGHPATPVARDGRREVPGRAEWTESVRRILAAIDAGDVRKVVLARQLVVEAGGPFDRRGRPRPAPPEPSLVLHLCRRRLRRGEPRTAGPAPGRRGGLLPDGRHGAPR